MKNLFLLAFLFFIQNSLAVAPYGIKGQAQSQTLYSNVHQFPNQNVTNIGGINALVYDSGLIFDGGFESATAFQGHTIVSGSAYFAVVTTASDVLDGKKTARVTCFNAAPSGVCKIEQTVNLGTPRLRGFPMLLSVRVDSSPDQPLTFCAKIDGVEKDCVTGYKGYLTIPTLAGVTSVGYTLSKNEYVSPLTSFFDSIKVEITETVTNAPVAGPRVAYTPTFTGFGTVTNINCGSSQIGSKAIVDCTFTSSGGTATEARVSLPSGLTIPTGLASLFQVGTFSSTDPAFFYPTVLAEQGASYLTFGYSTTSSSSGSLAKRNGNGVVSSTNTLSFTAIVPIAQYQASVPTYSDRCRDPRNCETVFSAKVSAAGVVSEENLDWINSNASVTNTATYGLLFSVFSEAPNCLAIAQESVDATTLGVVERVPATSSGGSWRITAGNTAGPIAAAWRIICQRQGQDYINAKVNQIVGSFKDYVRTPNTATGKVGFCSAKISATGVISDQLGGCFASCTNATTPVCTFTSNYWKSGSVPNCWALQSSSRSSVLNTLTSTEFSALAIDGSGNPTVSARQYFCHGEIQ